MQFLKMKFNLNRKKVTKEIQHKNLTYNMVSYI